MTCGGLGEALPPRRARRDQPRSLPVGELDPLGGLIRDSSPKSTSDTPGSPAIPKDFAATGRRRSASMKRTREPTVADAIARLRATVVFPSPGAAERSRPPAVAIDVEVANVRAEQPEYLGFGRRKLVVPRSSRPVERRALRHDTDDGDSVDLLQIARLVQAAIRRWSKKAAASPTSNPSRPRARIPRDFGEEGAGAGSRLARPAPRPTGAG